MKKQQLNNIMDKAQHICAYSGGRLTEKRKRILELLLRSKIPVSPYEVADLYNRSSGASMPTMSVYHIL